MIDSHVHFDWFAKQGLLDELLDHAAEKRVEAMVSVGGSSTANALSRRLATVYPGLIFASAGYDRDLATEACDLTLLRSAVADPLVKAVGETGLDYFHMQKNNAGQQKLFGENLALAAEFKKPVIVHSRQADADTLAMLADHARTWKGDAGRLGVLHCFTLNMACAGALLDMGMMISFSGIITFASAEALREVVPYVPDDRILIETDTPYLAPLPKRGQQNEPAFLVHVAEKMAALRGVAVETLATTTTTNARHLFALKEGACV